MIVVDTAHGHSQGVLDRVAWVKKRYPQMQVIGGNVATAAGAKALVDHGADGVKVGIGPGLDLHDAHRRRRRRAADHGDRTMRWRASAARTCRDRRRRHPLLGRHRQGARRGRARRDARQPVRRHRGSAGRDRALPGPLVQELSRHGLASARCSRAVPTATSRTPKAKRADKLVPEGIEGRVPYKGPLAT